MTGTPLDLTPFGPLLKALGPLYWLAAALCIALALWWLKPRWLKFGAAVVIAVAFAAPVLRHEQERQAQFDAAKVKLSAATAHFEMRCKSAGERITRTVENVDGIVWMKWRDKYDINDDYDQFRLSDPYGRDCNAEKCIEQLLRATRGFEFDTRNEQVHAKTGFRYAESIDPHTQQKTRYSRQIYRQKDRDATFAAWATATELVPVPVPQFSARYGVTWDDISTREDRQYWIAGGSIKIVDLQTNEVIAERIGYMMDQGQGSTAGFTVPWQMARRTACPAFPGGQIRHPIEDSTLFILKVLKPTEEK
jgi:hypothetical protein